MALLGCAAFAAAPPAEDREKADGFVPLFNGTDLSGWKVYDGKPEGWTAADGLLVCTGAKGGGWLGTRRDYADFVLRLEYRLRPGGNSGVYLRAPETGWISRAGMEIQILDDNDPRYAKLDFYQYTGAIYHVAAPTRRAGKPAGQWNALEVRCEGRRVVVVLNGKKVQDADLDWLRKGPAVAREHPGLARTTGRIGLQNHSERVEFRRLRVKELRAGPPSMGAYTEKPHKWGCDACSPIYGAFPCRPGIYAGPPGGALASPRAQPCSISSSRWPSFSFLVRR